MYYCYSIKRGLFDGEIQHAKDLGVYLYYDENQDLFIDQDNYVIDIKGKDIFPRTGVLQSKKLVEAVARHGGNSLIRSEDYEKVLNWPNYIGTKRNNIIVSGRQILNDYQSISDIFGKGKVFFKTKNKNFSQIIDLKKFIEKETPFKMALEAHKDDDFIISDVVDIVEDEYGPLEYRGFIVNDQILNVSRVHDYLLSSIPSDVIDKLQTTIDNLKETDFPDSYVIDLFICKDNGKNIIEVLECNPIVSSGTYLYNTVFERTYDLEHKCPSRSLPEEKIKYGYVEQFGFDVKHKPIPSICYELPGGFAADLVSISVFGKPSTGAFIHIDSEGNIDPMNIGRTNIKPIESDSDLLKFNDVAVENGLKLIKKKI